MNEKNAAISRSMCVLSLFLSGAVLFFSNIEGIFSKAYILSAIAGTVFFCICAYVFKNFQKLSFPSGAKRTIKFFLCIGFSVLSAYKIAVLLDSLRRLFPFFYSFKSELSFVALFVSVSCFLAFSGYRKFSRVAVIFLPFILLLYSFTFVPLINAEIFKSFHFNKDAISLKDFFEGFVFLFADAAAISFFLSRQEDFEEKRDTPYLPVYTSLIFCAFLIADIFKYSLLFGKDIFKGSSFLFLTFALFPGSDIQEFFCIILILCGCISCSFYLCFIKRMSKGTSQILFFTVCAAILSISLLCAHFHKVLNMLKTLIVLFFLLQSMCIIVLFFALLPTKYKEKQKNKIKTKSK